MEFQREMKTERVSKVFIQVLGIIWDNEGWIVFMDQAKIHILESKFQFDGRKCGHWDVIRS